MLKTLKEIEVSGKRVLLRADLDVPIENGKVGEDYRLRALSPTLNYLLENKAEITILGHLGRPNGKEDSTLSLKPVAARLSELSGRNIDFLPQLPPNPSGLIPKLLMLENLRFWPGEEENDPAFAKQLAGLGDLYVNDSFAASHRAHASIVGVPQHLPACAGLRLAEEVKELGGVLGDPERPLVFILGGAKTETKAPLVPNFAEVADSVLLGGLLMFDQSLRKITHTVFPVDAVETFDIGPETEKKFTEIIKNAKTVVWNGPMGKWEEKQYESGTRRVAEALAELPAKTIVGGGDTIAALSAFGLLEKMKYVSMGGGAMLEFLAGKKLPGLVALGY
jgi:phosphoglycerate kinase